MEESKLEFERLFEHEQLLSEKSRRQFELDEWGVTSIHCPAGYGSDVLMENRYYKV